MGVEAEISTDTCLPHLLALSSLQLVFSNGNLLDHDIFIFTTFNEKRKKNCVAI